MFLFDAARPPTSHSTRTSPAPKAAVDGVPVVPVVAKTGVVGHPHALVPGVLGPVSGEVPSMLGTPLSTEDAPPPSTEVARLSSAEGAASIAAPEPPHASVARGRQDREDRRANRVQTCMTLLAN